MKKFLSFLGLVGLMAAQAQAALVAPVLDSADAITVGGAVVAGLAAIWGIRQAIYLVR